jgi:hypothetical protein
MLTIWSTNLIKRVLLITPLIWLIELLNNFFQTNHAFQPKEFKCFLLTYYKMIIFRTLYNYTYT